MKKNKRNIAVSATDPDEILPEYDFSRGRPNKYASRYRKGALVVTLDPEVARVFPTAADVNRTLKSLARIIGQTRPGKTRGA
jgi:hypothetical protein